MTTLISIIAIDARGPSALYLVSDSRITWEPERPTPHHVPGKVRWDAGRKLFTSSIHADIFGYAGEVLFPVLALSQIVDAADLNLLFAPGCDAASRHRVYYDLLKSSFNRRAYTVNQDFSILHGARENSGMNARFRIWLITFRKDGNIWHDEEICVPDSSSTQVLAIGTGATAAREYSIDSRYRAQGNTSRAAFWAFCDVLRSGKDPLTGGAPQLAGIYRTRHAQSFGIVYNGMRYLHGLPLPEGIFFDQVEWRDELFQRVDGGTAAILEGAQRHGR